MDVTLLCPTLRTGSQGIIFRIDPMLAASFWAVCGSIPVFYRRTISYTASTTSLFTHIAKTSEQSSFISCQFLLNINYRMTKSAIVIENFTVNKIMCKEQGVQNLVSWCCSCFGIIVTWTDEKIRTSCLLEKNRERKLNVI